MKHLTFEQGLDAWQAGNTVDAVSIWQNLAENGDVRSQYNLGVLHDQGQGVEKNPWEAFHWFELAARQGYADAQFNLALMLFNGEGCRRSEESGMQFLLEAAHQNHADALFNLGQMHVEGNVVEQDWEKAVFFLRQSAELGHALAANNLAIRYAMGQGLTRSDFDAYVWFNIAVLLGDAGAVRHRERVAPQLSSEDIVRAGKLSTEQVATIHAARRN